MDKLHHFPFAEGIHYFDYAATTCMPQQVIDAWTTYQNQICVDVGRGRSKLSSAAKNAWDTSVKQLEHFFGLPHGSAWLLGKNVTEVINLAALGMEHWIQPMDHIVVGPFEHHSNYLPWRFLAKRRGGVFFELPIDSHGNVDLDYFSLICKRIKVFSYSSVSNATGYQLDAAPLLERLPADSIVCCDVSQQAGHQKIQLPDRVDIAFLPSHKMYGPKGIAAAVFRPELLELLQPTLLGGGMVKSVGMDVFWADGDRKYAAGTMDTGLLCAWAAAAAFLESIGWDRIEAFEAERFQAVQKILRGFPHVKILYPPSGARSILSFTCGSVHPHDLEYALSRRDVIIRAGHLCTQNSIRRLGADAISRISFGLGVSDEDIDALASALEENLT